MKCPSCGYEIPNDSLFCNKCGKKIIQEEFNTTDLLSLVNSKDALDNNISNHIHHAKKKIMILVSLLLVSVCLLGLGIYILVPYSKYYQAINYQNQQEYEKAIQTFIELDNYSDSKKRISECIYQEGIESFNNKKYEDAIQKFKEAQMAGYINVQNKLSEAQYDLGNKLLEKKEYTNASIYFELVGDFKDSKDLLSKSLFLDGKTKYDAGDFSDAETKIKASGLVTNDSTNILALIKILKPFQGTWQEIDNETQLVISGWNITVVYSPNTNKSKSFDYSYTFHGGDKIYTSQRASYMGVGSDGQLSNQSVSVDYVLKNGKLESNEPINDILSFQQTGEYKYKQYKKISDVALKSLDGYEPRIGLTAEEVRQSTWGSPDKINKTTTSSVVHEQWVYSGNRYIYLDNGIVSAIQN